MIFPLYNREKVCYNTFVPSDLAAAMEANMKETVFILREGFSAEPVPAKVREKMQGSTYRKNEHIKFEDLMYLRVRYVDFSHNVADGEIIVHKTLAREVLMIFEMLFDAEYEIEKIRLVDEYGGDDEKSMADNNSSGFNFRTVAGTQNLSMHALGRAIDINPAYNPYIVGEKVFPESARQYLDRQQEFAHKISHHDICFKVFRSFGWLWGGDWNGDKDYQHFYKPKDNPVKSAVKKIKDLVSD